MYSSDFRVNDTSSQVCPLLFSCLWLSSWLMVLKNVKFYNSLSDTEVMCWSSFYDLICILLHAVFFHVSSQIWCQAKNPFFLEGNKQVFGSCYGLYGSKILKSSHFFTYWFYKWSASRNSLRFSQMRKKKLFLQHSFHGIFLFEMSKL